ncbi:hypothetical protein EHO65_02570 [Leptospira andrefontaineae]|uniref:Uncharacterized protein n=2 Tax=Leptospira andrefontaineae TaxID=2484976 RepID=A0A4R9HAH4_9LEPT|nr:hypothetical protein EHO65_02570 [Leptospira andrefontaineae]
MKRISEIKIGDYVKSLNEETGEVTYKKVLRTYQREVSQVYKVTYENGTSVTATGEHPFRVTNGKDRRVSFENNNADTGRNSSWVKAGSLTTKDRSITLASIQNAEIRKIIDRQFAKASISLAAVMNRAQVAWDGEEKGTLGIQKVEVIEKKEKVYNLEVEENHTYFVSKDAVLVHNQCFESIGGQSFITLTKSQAEFLRNGGVFLEGSNKGAGASFTGEGITVRASREQAKPELDGWADKVLSDPKNTQSMKILSSLEYRQAETNRNNAIVGHGNLLRWKEEMKGILKLVEVGSRRPLSLDEANGLIVLKKFAEKELQDVDRKILSARKQADDANRKLAEKTKELIDREQKKTPIVDPVEKLAGADLRRVSSPDLFGSPSKTLERKQAEVNEEVRKATKRDISEKQNESYQKIVKEAFPTKEGRPGGEELNRKLELTQEKLSQKNKNLIDEWKKSIEDIKKEEISKLNEERNNHLKKDPEKIYEPSDERKKSLKTAQAKVAYLEEAINGLVNEKVLPFPKEKYDKAFELSQKGKLTTAEKNELDGLKKEYETHQSQAASRLKDEENIQTTLNNMLNRDRGELADSRNSKAQKLEDLERKLAQMDDDKDLKQSQDLKKEIAKLSKELDKIDKDILTGAPVQKPTDTLEVYLVREKDDYRKLPQAIEKIVDSLEKQKVRYKAEGNTAKAEALKQKIQDFKDRSEEAKKFAKDDVLTAMLRKGGKEREEAIAQMKEFLTHEGATRKLTITETVKNPVGDNPDAESVFMTSNFGRGGYGYTEVAHAAKESHDHIGADYAGEQGDRLNAVIEGTVIQEPGKGLSITVNKELPKYMVEKGISYQEAQYDSKGARTQKAGYHDRNGNSYSKEDLYKMDSEYRTGLSKTELKNIKPFAHAKTIGVVSKNGKLLKLASATSYVPLSTEEMAIVPKEIQEKPELVDITKAGSGNSLVTESTLVGEFAGTYRIDYKHMDRAPMDANGNPIKNGDPIKPGGKIGVMGSTGRATGIHDHITVISYGSEPPKGVNKVFYTPVKDKNNIIIHYLINPLYFQKVMAPSGAR